MNIIRFLKDWTLPVAIALGATVYLLFYYVPQLDGLGNRLGPVIDVISTACGFSRGGESAVHACQKPRQRLALLGLCHARHHRDGTYLPR